MTTQGDATRWVQRPLNFANPNGINLNHAAIDNVRSPVDVLVGAQGRPGAESSRDRLPL